MGGQWVVNAPEHGLDNHRVAVEAAATGWLMRWFMGGRGGRKKGEVVGGGWVANGLSTRSMRDPRTASCGGHWAARGRLRNVVAASAARVAAPAPHELLHWRRHVFKTPAAKRNTELRVRRGWGGTC